MTFPRAILLSMALAGAVAGAQPPAASAREDAYRANNVGVAFLEQFNYANAADKFREALRIDSSLAIARLNLAIALLYAPDLDGADREAAEAARLLPQDPHPPYVAGLAARARGGREDQARSSFERVLQMDPHDVGAQINLGQLDLQQQRYDQAIERFRAALADEPFSVTASYNLGLALTRAGRRDEGLKAMERSQAMRAGGYGIIFSANYLEQGRYAEAVASTGAEADLVDRTTPTLSFTPVPVAPGLQPAPDGAVALIDFDGDGDLDIVFVSPAGGLRLLNNDKGTFTEVTAAAGFQRDATAGAIGAVAGDYDNDGRPDLLLLRRTGAILFHNDGNGKFSRDQRAALPPYTGQPASAAFVDFDHDGDLDLVIAGDGPLQFVRNNGNGTFTDITAQTGVAGIAGTIAIVPTDFDNHRDIDLLVVKREGPPALFKNLRDGTFRDVAEETGLRTEGRLISVAAADINKDDFPDFFFGRAGAPGLFALSDGRGRFRIAPAPAASADATAAQFLDYDNDGLIDLLTWSSSGPHLLRNVGNGWTDATARAFPPETRAPGLGSPRALASADLDGDGGTDLLVCDTSGAFNLWRADGQSRGPAVRVRLAGRASNHDGVGAKIDLRAGSLRQRIETSSATPAFVPADVRFGLGSRARADVVRVLWPSGILQAETSVASPLTVAELDRKPSSCPFLYTWNGQRFEFQTDFMGGGEMGYWEAPGARNVPDPDEYVRIDGDRLAAKDGRYELRVTNELEEAVFLDRLQLLVLSHPADVDVFPNEGMADPPKPFRMFAVRDPQPPVRALDEHGHDVTARIAKRDRVYPDDFALAAFRGYAEPHTLTLTLPRRRGAGLLLLTGWTDYAFSSDNVAAHQAGLRLQPPRLEAEDGHGRWRTIVEDIGIPVGRPQTIVVELPPLAPSSVEGRALSEIRIVTNMRIYWDQILVAEPAPADAIRIDRLDPVAALLRWRGFSAEIKPDGREPASYDYDRVTSGSPWKTMPGRYTREGDVLPLVSAVDDQFVVSRPGDEVAASFDATRPGPAARGSKRTFFLYADGFSKEMDVNSASPDRVDPLPFHAMTHYPYAWPERYPETTALERYRSEYNTRIVAAPFPSIDRLRKP